MYNCSKLALKQKSVVSTIYIYVIKREDSKMFYPKGYGWILWSFTPTVNVPKEV